MLDILFVTPTEKLDICHESNGIMLLATKLLQADFSVKILRFAEDEHYNKDYEAFVHGMTEKILAASPRAVSFYTVWPHYHIMLRIAKEVKQCCRQMQIVLGGPQASATAMQTMQAMPFVDCISSGEGEDIVVPFFEALLNDHGTLDQIPGLYYRECGQIKRNTSELPLCDLNALPYWDERLYADHYEVSPKRMASPTYFMPIDAGRGCPYNCTFCCTSHFWKRTYRMKSPQRIVDDMRYFNEKFGIRSFWFAHDAFTINRQLVEQVCDHIIAQKMDIVWRCSTRIDCITEDLILKMKQAGLTGIEVGIETGSARMQKLTNKRLNLEEAQRKIEFMLKNGIKVALFFMYGFPEETEEDLNETLELLFAMIDAGIQTFTMSYTRFNPATQITNEHYDQLVLDPKIKVLTRAVFGYEQEKQVIADNKAIFPFFYHLSTPVRENFQYMIFFTHVYRQFPNAAKQLRKLYNGDNLRFYRDFCEVNEGLFDEDMEHATREVVDNTLQHLENMLKKFDGQWVEQLRGLMQYDWDWLCITKSKEDLVIERTYNFMIMDLQRRRSIEQYVDGKTQIRMEKTAGREKVKVLNIL